LRGSYRGASGNVALGVGLGAKVLIGASRRTVSFRHYRLKARSGSTLRSA
jgi:hypothetical protein